MKDIPESKEAYLHRMNDMRNIPEGDDIFKNVASHAQRDMAALGPDPPAKKETSWWQKTQAGQPSLMGEFKAIFREAVKDIRQTMNEVFFSTHEHAPEAGTPLNPTQIMTTDELRPDDYEVSHYQTRGHEHTR